MALANNKKAYHDYEIVDTLEAGVVLSGPEVKSVKQGRISLPGSYVTIDQQGEAWLVNAHIAPYSPAAGQQQDYHARRSRKLLLKKKEIDRWRGKLETKGLTLLPLKVYLKRGLIKIEVGLARGKKKWDKREEIKKKEWQRKKKRFFSRGQKNS